MNRDRILHKASVGCCWLPNLAGWQSRDVSTPADIDGDLKIGIVRIVNSCEEELICL